MAHDKHMAHDKIAPLTIKEMSELASRFEARAASVLLRDQPQLQSDMRLAARLINELTGRARTAGGLADGGLAAGGLAAGGLAETGPAIETGTAGT